MRASSWLLGVSAFIGNSMVILTEVTECETIAGLSNKCFIILIAVGDLLIGIYLIWLTLTDSFVLGHGEDYCRQQWSWLTIFNCSILGVLRTAGSQNLYSPCVHAIHTDQNAPLSRGAPPCPSKYPSFGRASEFIPLKQVNLFESANFPKIFDSGTEITLKFNSWHYYLSFLIAY